MAQSFKNVTELLAGFPDNVTGLISAENVRDFLVSIVEGKGLLEATDNVTLPIVADTWISINPLLLNAAHTETFWAFDGNNYAFSNHSNFASTTVPPGHQRFGQFMSILELTKSAGGSDEYSVQFTKNGAGIGEPESVEFNEAGTDTTTVLHPLLVDISLSTDLYGVQIMGIGTGVDLELGYFTMQVSDSILLAAP